MKRCSTWPTRALLVLVLVWVAGAFGCRRSPVVELKPLPDTQLTTPVIFLPGTTGSQLRDRETGRVLWGKDGNLFVPRDGGYEVALPIVNGANAAPDRVEAFAALLHMRVFGLLEIDIYNPLTDLLTRHGYRWGNLADPQPDDSLFVFHYDWRRANVETARQLGDFLERLRQVRGEPTLRVHLICHSNASRIARYFIKYGGVSLNEAQRGAATRSDRITVDKLILLASGNGGSLNVLHELDRGRRYVRGFGRHFKPEVLFTFRSLYEALPAYAEDVFIDAAGNDLDVDLYDASDWKRYGISVFNPKTAERLHKRQRDDLFGTADQREAFLAEQLSRARRFQELLIADVPIGSTRLYSVQNIYRPTPRRTVLIQRNAGWRLLWPSQSKVRHNPWLANRTQAPGDGHATHASQQWLSPQELAAMAGPTTYVPALHRHITQHPATQQRLLEILAEP